MATQYISLSDENAFQFVCPLFNAKTKMGSCTKLREMVWMGKHVPVRRGCQAAMRCGKCPAADMVSRYCFDKNWTNDHHGSVEPKEGKLMRSILERIRNVLMRDKVMDECGVPANERLLLESANERIDQQMKTAPGEASRNYTPTAARKTVSAPPTAPKESEINQAAATGNLTAAINA